MKQMLIIMLMIMSVVITSALAQETASPLVRQMHDGNCLARKKQVSYEMNCTINVLFMPI